MSDMNFATDNYFSYITAIFVDERKQNGLNTIAKKVDLNVNIDDLKKWLTHDQFFQIIEMDDSGTWGISANNDVIIDIADKRWALSIKALGSPIKVEQLIETLNEKFTANPCYIRWVYDEQYGDDITVPVNLTNMPIKEMYPFLGDESLESYYDRFVKSSANILVLIGPPGTGKTTWLRGLLAHTKKSATLTYHQKILQQDSFFVDWLRSNDMFMILEDADTLLLPREDGNELMARFLNMGDGLMGFTDKKLIFSTNLPSTRDIDSALTRKGRCFDILEFNALNRDQAQKVCDKMNLPLIDGSSFTVSELFAITKNEMTHSKPKSFGFV